MRGALAIGVMLTILGFGGTGAAEPQASLQTCAIKVEGMACGACAARVEREIKKIEGVTAATVSQPKSRADVTFDPAKTTPQKIAEMITMRTGFAAEPADK
jgi:copper chaperone CopZ